MSSYVDATQAIWLGVQRREATQLLSEIRDPRNPLTEDLIGRIEESFTQRESVKVPENRALFDAFKSRCKQQSAAPGSSEEAVLQAAREVMDDAVKYYGYSLEHLTIRPVRASSLSDSGAPASSASSASPTISPSTESPRSASPPSTESPRPESPLSTESPRSASPPSTESPRAGSSERAISSGNAAKPAKKRIVQFKKPAKFKSVKDDHGAGLPLSKSYIYRTKQQLDVRVTAMTRVFGTGVTPESFLQHEPDLNIIFAAFIKRQEDLVQKINKGGPDAKLHLEQLKGLIKEFNSIVQFAALHADDILSEATNPLAKTIYPEGLDTLYKFLKNAGTMLELIEQMCDEIEYEVNPPEAPTAILEKSETLLADVRRDLRGLPLDQRLAISDFENFMTIEHLTAAEQEQIGEGESLNRYIDAYINAARKMDRIEDMPPSVRKAVLNNMKEKLRVVKEQSLTYITNGKVSDILKWILVVGWIVMAALFLMRWCSKDAAARRKEIAIIDKILKGDLMDGYKTKLDTVQEIATDSSGPINLAAARIRRREELAKSTRERTHEELTQIFVNATRTENPILIDWRKFTSNELTILQAIRAKAEWDAREAGGPATSWATSPAIPIAQILVEREEEMPVLVQDMLVVDEVDPSQIRKGDEASLKKARLASLKELGEREFERAQAAKDAAIKKAHEVHGRQIDGEVVGDAELAEADHSTLIGLRVGIIPFQPVAVPEAPAEVNPTKPVVTTEGLEPIQSALLKEIPIILPGPVGVHTGIEQLLGKQKTALHAGAGLLD